MKLDPTSAAHPVPVSARPARLARLARLAVPALCLAVGFALRWHQLPWQILSDDEWHAVRTSVRESYWQIATGLSTSVVPLLAMVYKALYGVLGGASELTYRMPMLLAGLALIVVFPLVLPAGTLGRRGQAALAGLVAISPLLIYFSRYARPYALSVLLSTVAIFAFYRWWRREPGRWGTLFLVCGVLSPAFHMTTVTTMAAPFAWAFYEVWRGRGERPAREIWRLGLATGILIAVTVGPPILLDFRAIEKRAGANQVEYLTFRESLPLLAGVDGVGAVLLGLAALLGFVLLARRQPRLAAMLGFASLVTVIGTVLSGADSVQVPIVFVRYSLWLAPFFLLLVAAAAGAALDRLPAWAAWPALALALGLLFWAGPWRGTYGHLNNWTSHAIFQYTYRDDSPFSYERRPPHIPDLYRQLAQEPPGSLTLAEAPFYSEWHNNPLPYYQEVHRQRVVAGMLGGACDRRAVNFLPEGGARLAMRNLVDVSRQRDLESHGVDIVIFHKNMYQEMPRLRKNVARVPSTNLPPESGLDRCLPKYRRVLGKPFYEDDALVAFDFRKIAGREIDEKLFFSDGFESGDLGAWSRAAQ